MPPRLKLVASLLSLFLLLTTVSAQNDNQKKFDHRAHAVPGKPQTVRDYDGDGFAGATLNGELSHTHYFVPGPPAIVGKLVSYEWTENTHGSIIGTKIKATYNFPVGVTNVTLKVVDNSGDTSSNNVTITVLPSGEEGAYMYFYEMSTIAASLQDLTAAPRPQYGVAVKSVNFAKPEDFPEVHFITQGPFACRIIADYLAILDDNYVFFVSHGGGAVELFVDGIKRLGKMKTDTKGMLSVTEPFHLKKGKHVMDLIYYTPDPGAAQLVLGINLSGGVQVVPPSFLSHETNVILPTIHEITPDKSTLGAGGQMKIYGAGFTIDSQVRIGPYDVKEVYVKNDGEIHIKVPPADAPGDVLLEVTTSRGQSNAIHFSYTSDAQMPIKFKETHVKDADGKLFPSEQFTSVAIGPDLRYYFGSLDTHVHVLTLTHSTLVVQKSCKSTSAGNGRSVTSVSFNPGDRSIRAYISTNTFYWKNWDLLPEKDGWHNGKIQTLVQGSDDENPDVCMIHEKDVVTGLPVSNHDHGVNSLVWDNDGNLYAQVGGFTNAGHSVPGDLMGGIPESVLSGATIIIHLREPGFDGQVKYDQYEDPGSAKKISSDKFVEGFAYGFRNSYGSTFHSNGLIYATDNGPNKGYGKRSVTCNSEGDDPWHPDSLVLVFKDGYYGFPNRARGSVGDTRQCVYFSPTETSRNGFTSALAVFDASTNGILEYSANCFEGQLKGDLLLSKYAVGGKGKLYRVSLDVTGKQTISPPTELAEYSGLSIAMNPFGALVMPRVQQSNIAVLIPDEEYSKSNEPMLTAVMPNRGPQSGGNQVVVTGHNLVEDTKVFFGGQPCDILTRDAEQRWVFCRAPPGTGSVDVKITTSHGTTSAIREDYHYLNY